MDPFLGQMLAVAFDFAPNNWQPAAGQLLAISKYTALFSLLGTSFGGNGSSTFGLPNMQGMVALSSGQLLGGSYYSVGETGGVTDVTLSLQEMAAHTHLGSLFEPRSGTGNATQPGGNILAPPAANVYITGSTGNMNAKMNPGVVSQSGSNASHKNMMPYQVLNWVIAMQGIFPTRG